MDNFDLYGIEDDCLYDDGGELEALEGLDLPDDPAWVPGGDADPWLLDADY